MTMTDQDRSSENQVAFPRFHEINRRFPDNAVSDVAAAVDDAVDSVLPGSGIRPGDTVAVAVGSRGIAAIDVIVARLCRRLMDAGAQPVIIPAMGSHGGATAQGQQRILEDLGIDEGSTGARCSRQWIPTSSPP
jgi:Zn-dependent alcohol dehydrogenase